MYIVVSQLYQNTLSNQRTNHSLTSPPPKKKKKLTKCLRLADQEPMKITIYINISKLTFLFNRQLGSNSNLYL